MKKSNALERLRAGERLTAGQQLLLIFQLSIPAVLAQLSSIVMQYIDAAMVGSLGETKSASIGLVSSSTWLFGGLCSAAAVGYTVQIAHRIGHGEEGEARKLVKMGLLFCALFGFLLLGIGAGLSFPLPALLGGEESVRTDSSLYFLVFSLFLPVRALNYASAGALQGSGNIKFPGAMEILMCALDVLFNFALIFPTREVTLFGARFTVYGAGLSVAGAALGTGLAEASATLALLAFLLFGSKPLRLRRSEKFVFEKSYFKEALRLSLPVGFEQGILSGAQIVSTAIVAPLGNVAIAANSFAVTAESLCYMPGYGIGTAATTAVGQSVGAGRKDLVKRLGWTATLFGIAVMSVTAVLAYFLAPYLIGVLTPVEEIRTLGVTVLRLELFAEPMYAASIVASGVFRGAGDTLVPSAFNFCSMWLVRLPLAALLSASLGLKGVWIAMAIELTVRGILFLIRLAGKGWQKRCTQNAEQGSSKEESTPPSN